MGTKQIRCCPSTTETSNFCVTEWTGTSQTYCIIYHCISLHFLGQIMYVEGQYPFLRTASATWQTFKIEREQLRWRCIKCHNHGQKCGPELVKESIYNIHCTVTSGEADGVEWMRMRTQVQTNKWMRRFKLKMSLYWPLYQNTTKGIRKGTNKT